MTEARRRTPRLNRKVADAGRARAGVHSKHRTQLGYEGFDDVQPPLDQALDLFRLLLRSGVDVGDL